MSIQIETAVEAGTDLILGVATVVYYLTDANPAAGAILGLTQQEYADLAVISEDEQALREVARTTRFPQLAGRLAAFAREGVWSEGMGEAYDALSDLLVGVALLQGKDGPCLIAPDETCQVPALSAAMIQQLRLAVSARLTLDSDGLITVPMLAALAGVAEKTIRMAANPQNDRPLKTTKDGVSTFISAEDALEWLGRRADFKPSRYYTSKGGRPKFLSVSKLATHLRGAREERNETIQSVAKALSWGASTKNAYEQLEIGAAPTDLNVFQPSHLAQLAAHFDTPEPREFARECYPLIAAAYSDALVREQLS